MRFSAALIFGEAGRSGACLVLLVWLALLGGCDRPPAISPLPPDSVVLAFGDSLTAGAGAVPGEGYPEVLSGLLGRRVINAGRSGETSGEGLERFPGLLEQHTPSLVILIHGGNDFLRRLDPEETAANLGKMVDVARSAGADVILAAVPRPGLFLSPDPLYSRLAKEFGLPCEEEILSDILSDRDLKSDTIHPNAAGYARLAEALNRLIGKAQR